MKLLLSLAALTVNLLIPQQYQGNPDHPVRVIFVEPDQVGMYCGTKASQGLRVLACATKKEVLIMPNPCEYPEYKNPDSYARLLCHEKGHLMGWDHG